MLLNVRDHGIKQFKDEELLRMLKELPVLVVGESKRHQQCLAVLLMYYQHSSSLNDLRVVGYWWSLVIRSVNATMSRSSKICGLL